MSFPLETDRLFIRPFRDSDLASFLAYRDDPEVAKYQGWSVPYTLEQGQCFIDFMKNADPGQVGEWYQAAIELKDEGEMIGDVAHFLMKNDPQQAYLGYTIARSYWGRGLATEAMLRLLAYLFDELELHRVVAETDVENASSIHLLERLGFRRESHLVENVWFKGVYASEYHYALLRREWESR
jgi:RimJ/RimL family protein N-acetyltransferase